MNINKKAIDLFENHRYEEALKLFQQAVTESRDVQSLTNLAWMYSYEESDDNAAPELAKEAVSMNPTSHFPYSLLGEIYIRNEDWENASNSLCQSIFIQPTVEAYNNLGVAKYNLGAVQEAALYFLLSSKGSDYARYSHVKCLIEIGEATAAKRALDAFSEDDDDFVGTVEMAELYVELGDMSKAVAWFEKGWKWYSKEPSWINRYIYALIKTNDLTDAQSILQEAVEEKVEELQDAYQEECDENWTERDKEEYIQQLIRDREEYEQIIERISLGYIPPMTFNPSAPVGCYLFGCNRHNHPEYETSKSK